MSCLLKKFHFCEPENFCLPLRKQTTAYAIAIQCSTQPFEWYYFYYSSWLWISWNDSDSESGWTGSWFDTTLVSELWGLWEESAASGGGERGRRGDEMGFAEEFAINCRLFPQGDPSASACPPARARQSTLPGRRRRRKRRQKRDRQGRKSQRHQNRIWNTAPIV